MQPVQTAAAQPAAPLPRVPPPLSAPLPPPSLWPPATRSWGGQFSEIIRSPPAEVEEPRYRVELDRWAGLDLAALLAIARAGPLRPAALPSEAPASWRAGLARPVHAPVHGTLDTACIAGRSEGLSAYPPMPSAQLPQCVYFFSFFRSYHDVRCPLLEAEDEEEARSQASQARGIVIGSLPSIPCWVAHLGRQGSCTHAACGGAPRGSVLPSPVPSPQAQSLPAPGPALPPQVQNVVHRAKRAVPYPLLGENTLVLSDLLCVRPAKGGRGGAMELVCRCAAACLLASLLPVGSVVVALAARGGAKHCC